LRKIGSPKFEDAASVIVCVVVALVIVGVALTGEEFPTQWIFHIFLFYILVNADKAEWCH
jgi:hypothetical protein